MSFGISSRKTFDKKSQFAVPIIYNIIHLRLSKKLKKGINVICFYFADEYDNIYHKGMHLPWVIK